MTIFSVFVQAAEGATYAIVPYVLPEATGTVSGIVGAGGNIGGVVFGTIFRRMEFDEAVNIMSGAIFISAALSVFISVKGFARLFTGEIESEDDAVEHEKAAYLKKDAVHMNPYLVDDDYYDDIDVKPPTMNGII
mmetsp:Transcript_38741/g.54555  ORF Transcript_38741/g.54555 Transcript_38741/m.54555 type:complete len:135 (-) Transcript_38741:386-790(-)